MLAHNTGETSQEQHGSTHYYYYYIILIFHHSVHVTVWMCVCVPHSLSHDVSPVAVHHRELASLLWHLGHDVLGAEDGLQVEPGGLAVQQAIQDHLHAAQLLLPQLQPCG